MTRYYVRKSIRRWAFLEPWCAFLREHAELQVVHDHKSDLMLCVRLRPEPHEPLAAYDERVRCLREALELLTTVAFVDVLAWQDLLRDKCGCARAPFWDDWRLPLGLWVKLGDAKLATLVEDDSRFYRAFFAPFSAPATGADAAGAAASGGQVVRHTARMAMQGILREMTPAMHRSVRRHGKVEVCMRFVPRRGIETDRSLAYLQGVVATVRECLAVAAAAHDDVMLRYMSKLALNDTELHIGELPLPAGSAQLLAEFVALDTNTAGFYPVLDFGAHTALGKLPLVELEPLLRAIATRVSTSNKQVANGGHATFPLNDESFALVGLMQHENAPQTSHAYARRFKALFSALAVSQCFDQLNLERSIGYSTSCTRGKKWQWLAYALLSKDSAAGVTKLTLSEPDVRQADMNAIVSILNTRNPAGKLGGLCRTSEDQAQLAAELTQAEPDAVANEWIDSSEDSEDDSTTGENDEDPDVRAFYSAAARDGSEAAKSDRPTVANVRSGATIRVVSLNNETELTEPETFVLPTDRTFRVIDDGPGSDRVGILVPCYGCCSAPRDAVVLAKSDEASDGETSISWGYRGSIRCLRLNPTAPLKLAILLPLLRYLGSKLIALETTHLVDLDATNLRQVLEACPHLEILYACLSHRTIDSELLAAYAEERCNISDLRFSFFSRTDQALKFVRTLQDRTSRATRIVEKLTILSDPDEPLDRVVLTAILEMLESNVVLELLQIEVSLEHMKEFKPLFMKFHGQVITGVREPFPIECRTAFLSVVAYFSKGCASPPKRQRRARAAQIGQLDRGVVALIFQFAAERKSRRVRVFETEV
ncbi:hypothetical protein PybrP1_000745 [[Pythium] brassicae (nom. inval.)]|nr:hypothetical protein PybrP1_000745 [[Pythium] brassicae (nom. inval.)]